MLAANNKTNQLYVIVVFEEARLCSDYNPNLE